MRGKRRKKEEGRNTSKIHFWPFSESRKSIWDFDSRIFAIRSCVPTESIKEIKRNIYEREQWIKRLRKWPTRLYGIYSFPTAAGHLCKVGSAIAAAVARLLKPNNRLSKSKWKKVYVYWKNKTESQLSVTKCTALSLSDTIFQLK